VSDGGPQAAERANGVKGKQWRTPVAESASDDDLF